MRRGLNLFWPETNVNQSLVLVALLTWGHTRRREFRRYRKEGREETGSHRVIENHEVFALFSPSIQRATWHRGTAVFIQSANIST